MVGTSPIVSPSRRHRREVSSIVSGGSKIDGGLAGAVSDLFLSLGGIHSAAGRGRVLSVREGARADLLGKALGGFGDLVGQVCVPLHKLRRLASGQPEHVVEHQYLAIRAGAGSDSDGQVL